MDKFNKILKNVLIFLVIFLALNYVLQSCQKKEDTMVKDAGDIAFFTTKNEYSRTKPVTIKLVNNTDKEIILPNECPAEPFDVYHYENSEWIKKESTPDLDCSKSKDYILTPGKDYQVPYENWNHALFYETGRFKIEMNLDINGETKTFTTNEFTVVEEGIFTKLWDGVFYRPIYNALIFLTYVLPAHSLGWAIIFLTLIIRTILLIPSQKAMRSQKKMQDIQPHLAKIKEKYKGDQQKIASETMAVWKEGKVNPFGSCLPMLLQIPFLIAFFYAIKGGLNPDNSYLLYNEYAGFGLKDIDTNFLGFLDLTKVGVYALAIIIGGLQFVQMKLSMARNAKKKQDGKKEQKNEMAAAGNMMTYFMPVMIAVFTYSLPAGVGLYWGASTIYAIIQQMFVNREKPDKDEPKVRVIETKPEKNPKT